MNQEPDPTSPDLTDPDSNTPQLEIPAAKNSEIHDVLLLEGENKDAYIKLLRQQSDPAGDPHVHPERLF